jgi:hypothetical protein
MRHTYQIRKILKIEQYGRFRRSIGVSVNFDEMSAHLDRQRRDDTKKQFEERSTNATAAFLLCFFLGYLGAHRFYLGQWRVGLAHLAVFLLGAASAIAGFFTAAPLDAALWVIGGVLILASLIWEIIDLGRIDEEIHKRNLLIAEGLIAGALLSDHTILDQAASKLDEAVQAAAAQSRSASYDPSATMPGVISAVDLANAKALAEESGRAAISYHEVSNFTVSATPDERSGATTPNEPMATTITDVTSAPASADAAPTYIAETTSHTEEGYRVTDSEETDRVSGPSAAEALGAVGLGGAALGAAGLGVAAFEAAQSPEASISEPGGYATPEAAPELVAGVSTETFAATGSAPATPGEIGLLDITDASAPTQFDPASDVAFAGSRPTYITLPLPAVQFDPIVTASPAGEAPLTISAAEPPATPAPTADSYVPPVPQVFSAEPESETSYASTYASGWDTATTPMPPAAEPAPVPAPQTPRALDLAAGLGGMAGATALTAAALSHADEADTPTEPATAEAAAPKMKRIRVKHRIVVEGQVVREEVVEREIPADEDMAEAARRIQAELEAAHDATPDEIARLANLSNADVEVKRSLDGPAQ